MQAQKILPLHKSIQIWHTIYGFVYQYEILHFIVLNLN